MSQGYSHRLNYKRKGMLAMLVDVSTSMALGSRIPALKKTCLSILEEAGKLDRKVVFCAWDHTVKFHDASTSTPEASTAWINALVDQEKNDMRYAIEQTMKNYPDVTDCYIMCDGDVSPFKCPGTITDSSVLRDVPPPVGEAMFSAYNGTDWLVFRKRWPRVVFHFIAYGSDADCSAMKTMTDASGQLSTFTQVIETPE